MQQQLQLLRIPRQTRQQAAAVAAVTAPAASARTRAFAATGQCYSGNRIWSHHAWESSGKCNRCGLWCPM